MPSTSGKNAFDVGAFLAHRREELGLTQEQIVEKTGIKSTTYLSYLENGRVNAARSKHFPLLARALRLTEDEVRALNPDAIVIAFDSNTTELDRLRRELSSLKERLQALVNN